MHRKSRSHNEEGTGIVVTIADSTSVTCDDVATLKIELEGRSFTTAFYTYLIDCYSTVSSGVSLIGIMTLS